MQDVSALSTAYKTVDILKSNTPSMGIIWTREDSLLGNCLPCTWTSALWVCCVCFLCWDTTIHFHARTWYVKQAFRAWSKYANRTGMVQLSSSSYTSAPSENEVDKIHSYVYAVMVDVLFNSERACALSCHTIQLILLNHTGQVNWSSVPFTNDRHIDNQIHKHINTPNRKTTHTQRGSVGGSS